MIRWTLKELPDVGSTQDMVRELAAEGAPEGTVVIAKRQSAGRGRHGRAWVSPEGGLYMSLLLRPPSSRRIQTLTLLASLAVARGIKNATGLKVRLRWPNDVMIADGKVAGVIAESSYSGQELSFVTVGIGVNCNTRVPSADSWSHATDLAKELGCKVDIQKLRDSILEAFGVTHEEWFGGADAVQGARSIMETLGKRIVITTKSGETLEGEACGIDSEGGLVVERGGKEFTLRAEDVERLRES